MDGVAAARRLLVDICVEVEVCPVQVLHHEILPRTKLLADVVAAESWSVVGSVNGSVAGKVVQMIKTP